MIALLATLWAVQAVPHPDTAVTRAIAVARDSLSAVSAAGVAFRADLDQASPQLVLARTQRVQARCRGASAAAARLDSVLATPRVTHTLSPAALRAAVANLGGTLAECVRQYDAKVWAPRVDSLKAWAPYRLSQLDAAITRYTRAVDKFRRDHGWH